MNDVFKYILSDYLDDEDKKNILHAKIPDDFDIAKILGISVRYDNDFALKYASQNGYLDVVEFLVDKAADIHNCNEVSLKYASRNGHLL